MPATITLGSLVVSESQVVDGVRWLIEPIVGWDDLPDVDLQVSKRPSADGSWLSTATMAGRVLQINGRLIGSDWTAMARASAALMAAVPVYAPSWLTVAAGAETPMTALVQQYGKPLVEPDGRERRFSISLIAPDPRRYSTTLTTASTGLPSTSGGITVPFSLPVTMAQTVVSGRLLVTNAGNFGAPMTLTVTGPCPAFSVTHVGSGRRINVPEAVDVGRVLTIDTDRRTALLDGVAARTVTGSWFDLAPGVNELAFSASSHDPSALLGISFRSAWR